MPVASIPTILLIAIVLNLLLMLVLVVSLRRRPRRGAERAAAGSAATAPASHAGPTGRAPVTIGSLTTDPLAAGSLAAIAPAPTRALPEALAPLGEPIEMDADDTDEHTSPSAEAVSAAAISADFAEADENGNADESEAMSDTQPTRRRFVMPDHSDERATEAIEAFFSSGPQGPENRLAQPADATMDAGPQTVPPNVAPAPSAPTPAAWRDDVDAETGLETADGWSRSIAEEAARHARYRRSVSVVIAELDGLGRLSDVFGVDVAERLIVPVADTLRRNARATDRVARLGRGRFAVMLPETDEIQSINYVERVRTECDRWLASAAVAVRLSMGWASPAADGDFAAAVRRAEDRMRDEQRRPAPWWGGSQARPIVGGTSPSTPRTN